MNEQGNEASREDDLDNENIEPAIGTAPSDDNNLDPALEGGDKDEDLDTSHGVTGDGQDATDQPNANAFHNFVTFNQNLNRLQNIPKVNENLLKNFRPTQDLLNSLRPAQNLLNSLRPAQNLLNSFRPTQDLLNSLRPAQNLLKDFQPTQDLLKNLRLTPGLTTLTANDQKVVQALLTGARSASSNLSAARALAYPSLKDVGLERETAYSPEMTSFSSYFEQWEGLVDSFEEFQVICSKIRTNNPGFNFLWRGQRNAAWPLHSSLYRQLWDFNGVHGPHDPHRETEPFPTEEEMAGAEQAILNYVRNNWRFEDTSALSIFARLQHFGAPTRLMDFSRNPLIAAWFATEKQSKGEEQDCRIFALATATAPRSESEKANQEQSSKVGTTDAREYNAFWHLLDNPTVRGENEWGTGRLRRFWIPPMYESRIAAQNGCFILDGVPLDSPDLDKYFRKPGSPDSWKIGDRLASGSISARFSKPSRKVGTETARSLPPSFTLRITAKAKREIRIALESHYSYDRATIYPDIQGAAHAVTSNLTDLLSNPCS